MSSAALRSVARAIPRATASRAFSTTVVYEKTVTETVKDGIRTVDQAVSSKIVDGINAAETAGQKIKEASENATGHDSAAGMAEDLKGKAKGATEEAKGKVKGAAEDAKKKL